MGVLLLTIVGEIIAGVAVHGITQGFSRSGGNQTVIIERHFFHIPEIRRSSRSSSDIDEDTVWGLLAVLFFLFMMLIIALVGMGAIFAQNINTILKISYWITIVLSIIGGLLLVTGFFQGKHSNDWSVVQVAFYSLVLCVVIGGLIWLIYQPPNAPVGYDEMLYELQELNLQDEGWKSKAIEIGVVEFFTINPIIKFIALQAIGTLPMFLTILSVIYVQISLAYAIFTGSKANISIYVLIGALITAVTSSLFLGIAG